MPNASLRFLTSLFVILVLLLANYPARAQVDFTTMGTRAGDGEVTSTGQLRYTIPLWTPPGVRGIEPRLALLYGSEVRSGLLGMGWTLGGLSKIARCSRTVAQHAVAQPVSLTMTDAFCMDGQTLRITSGTYGQSGSQYQTEFADFSLVTANGSLGNGPAWFEVKTRNGLIYEYGNTADSRALLPSTNTPYVWALNKIRDRDGNNLKVTYATTSGTLRPTLIQYTQSSLDASYPYAVVFNYSARTGPDIESGYVAGNNFAQSQQLDSIEVRHGGPQGTLVRSYRLFYSFSFSVRRSLFNGIQECAGSNGLDCKPSTIVSYFHGSAGVAVSPTVDGTIDSTGRTLLGDVNGDGRTDIVYQETLPQKRWWMRLATATGYGAPIWTGAMNTDDVLLNDFVGSGKEDVLAPDANGNWVRQWWNGSSMSGTTTTLVRDPNVIRGTNPYGASPPPSFASADVNGDGLPDLIWAAIYNNTPSIFTRLNTTVPGGALTFSSTMTAAYSLPLPITTFGGVFGDHPMPTSDVQRMDFNGDQRGDAFFVTHTGDFGLTANAHELISLGSTFASGPVISDYGYLIAPLNFNDDACTDFGVGIRVQLSGCNGTAGQAVDTPGFLHMMYMDWNGDGRTDIIPAPGLGTPGNVFSVMYSNGGAAAASVSTSVLYDSGSTYMLVDQDGDALTDVARRTTSTAALAFHRHNAAGVPPGYVGSVSSEGPGPTFQVQYKSIVQGNYAPTEASIPAIAYPQVQFTAPMYVVSRLMMAAGETTKDYFYWSARRDLQGRSFQGFARRRVLDNRSGMYFYEDYRDTFPYTGQVWLQRLFQSDNTTLVYLHQNVWSEWTLDSNPVNKRVFPFISAYLQKRYEVGGPNNGTFVSHRTVGQVMDAWGSLLQLSITNFEQATGLNPGAVYTEIYNYPTITNDTVNWCLNKPTQLLHKASTNLPGGSEIIRTTNYAWDYAKCRLTSEVTEPANAQWQVTRDLEYDTVGNVKKVTLTPASGQGQVARSTQVDYGTTGQFPRTVTDPMGAVTQIAWDVAKGVRTSITDPNGLQTSWTYNNFGRLIRETRPDGTKTERAIIDCDDVPCGYPDVVPQIEARTTLLDAANNVIRSESRFMENSGRIRAIERDRMAGPRSIQRFKYDTWGRIIEETAPYIAGDPSFTTSYTYDALSRVTRLRRPMSDGNAANNDTLFAFSGLTETRTDALGHITTLKRDPLGRIVQVIDAANQDTDYEYEPFGKLAKIRDPGGAETVIAYNIRGMQISSNDPDMGPWTYNYFPLGELKSQTDAKNKTISFTYDALSRMLTQTMPEGASDYITSTFAWGTSDPANNIGRLQSMQIAGTGLTTYSEAYLYDSVGRLSQTTYTEGTTNYLVNYAYDANHGLLSQVTYPTSTSGFRLPIQYEYQHGFLSRVFDSSNQFWVANASDAANRVTSATLGEVTNGVTFQTLSDYDRVTGLLGSRTSTFNSGAVSGTSIANLGYVYDAVGNVIQRQDNQQGLTENFYYDALDRLDYSTLGGVPTDYNYDNRGNLTAKTGVGTLYSYTANVAGCTYYAHAQPHAVRQITGGSATMNFCYDQNGNMTNRNGTALTWFADSLPKTITKDANNSSTFQYGPNGQRWRHVYRTAGSNYTHTYIGNLLEKVVGPTTTDWKHYIYANGERVAMYIRKSNSAKDRYFFTPDRLGSVAAISHSDGAWVLRESFDAFGQRRAPTTWTGAPSASDLTQMNDKSRRGFTMHEHLDSTGLIHMNGRVFDPQIARFASADPFVQNIYNLQSLNRYSYVGNNPLRAADPTGFFPDICPGCDIDINFPSDYPWPDLVLCFINCPMPPAGPPASTPVTCVILRGMRFCGSGDLFGRPRTPAEPPPLVPGDKAEDADPTPMPASVTLAAENVTTLPYLRKDDPRQQINIDDDVYTLIPVPEGYGIDQDYLMERLKEGGLSSTNDVHYVPLSENPQAPTKVYVSVSTGDIAPVPDINQTPEQLEQDIRNPPELEDRLRKERLHQLYNDKAKMERARQLQEELDKKIGGSGLPFDLPLSGGPLEGIKPPEIDFDKL